MGISEKKTQIVINNYFKQECDVNTSIREAFEKGFRIGIKKASSAKPDWIPCSVRLPEDYSDVLVWFEYFRYGSYNRLYQTYGIGNYSAQYDAWTVNHETGWNKLRVIAWRPLPEAYKEEENGQN